MGLAERLMKNKWMLTCAESCTGGMLSMRCTEHAGSSRWFERGFVTYSNQAKVEMLGVDEALIETNGAVSEPVAEAMADGALKHSQAHVAVSITGIAGPDGGSSQKPVGTVWFGFAIQNQKTTTVMKCFDGSRQDIRLQSCVFAEQFLSRLLDDCCSTDSM